MNAPARTILVAVLIAVTGGYLLRASKTEAVPLRESLASCPVEIGDWSGRDAEPLDTETLAALGVDEYLNRLYATRSGALVGLYVGYYASQRQGDTIHSPLNCLPGAGWLPVKTGRAQVAVASTPDGGPAPDGRIEVNRFVIEKGLDRQVVIYWYQSRGRVVASEYWGRFYLMADAIRRNRTDGAMVRVISPILTTEEDAERHAIDFVQQLFPLLHAYLPS